jgi:hypothetical protein
MQRVCHVMLYVDHVTFTSYATCVSRTSHVLRRYMFHDVDHCLTT